MTLALCLALVLGNVAFEGGAFEGGAFEGGAFEGGAFEGGAFEGVTFEDGLRAYEAGRYAEALELFAQVEQVAGDAAPPGVLYGQALAALGAGALDQADAAVVRAAAAGHPAEQLTFLAGNIAFARARRAAFEAQQPDGGPFAWDRAIRHASQARDAWRRAAMRPEDWPPARRNVERAQRALVLLRAAEARADELRRSAPSPQHQSSKPQTDPAPDEPTTSPQADPQEDEELRVQPQLTELLPEQVDALLEQLAEKDREKRVLRQADRRARAVVERDW